MNNFVKFDDCKLYHELNCKLYHCQYLKCVVLLGHSKKMTLSKTYIQQLLSNKYDHNNLDIEILFNKYDSYTHYE